MHEKQPNNTGPEKDPNQQDPSHEAGQQPSPAIYVASLADYNNGVLHGAWIDAAREPAAIKADIDAMLAQSREPAAEEFAIHDYDQFGPCRIHEHDPIDLVARIARGIHEHGYAFAAWADVHEGQPRTLGTTSRTPTSATTTQYRTMSTSSSTTSATPTNSPNCPSHCSLTCASTPKRWRATWSCPATSMPFATRLAASGSSAPMRNNLTDMEKPPFVAIYLSKPRLCVVFNVVELYPAIESIQQFGIQWELVKETILMTPEQTRQLVNLLSNKRAEAGLSVNEVARRALVDPGTAWRIERGLIPTPKAESLLAIGKVLGIPAVDLFALVGWIPRDELPSFGPYLRARYGQLPEGALREIEAHFVAVASPWGISSGGLDRRSTEEKENSE